MASFNLEDYETVEQRLEKFWKKYPEGRVATNLVKSEDNEFIILAAIYADREAHHPIATGYAHEVVGVGMVNKTSALENCETSAIGRALANAGFATSGKRASRTEMEKVQRGEQFKPAKAKPAEVVDAKLLGTAFELVRITNDLDALKDLWREKAHLLDVDVDGTTLRDLIMKRKAEIENA